MLLHHEVGAFVRQREERENSSKQGNLGRVLSHLLLVLVVERLKAPYTIDRIASWEVDS